MNFGETASTMLALLGISGREVASRVLQLADISGPMCDELVDRLIGTDSWRERSRFTSDTAFSGA